MNCGTFKLLLSTGKRDFQQRVSSIRKKDSRRLTLSANWGILGVCPAPPIARTKCRVWICVSCESSRTQSVHIFVSSSQLAALRVDLFWIFCTNVSAPLTRASCFQSGKETRDLSLIVSSYKVMLLRKALIASRQVLLIQKVRVVFCEDTS